MALPETIRKRVAYATLTIAAPFTAGYFREELQGEVIHPLLLYAAPGTAMGMTLAQQHTPDIKSLLPAVLAPMAYVAGRVARVLSQPETRQTLERLLFP